MGARPKIGSGLTAKEEATVYAIVSGQAHSAADAVRIAGYSTPTAEQASSVGYEVTNRPDVKSAIQRELDKLPGGAVAYQSKWLRHFIEDSDEASKRPSGVAALKLQMQAYGSLNADVNVSVDARSVIVPGAAALSVEELEAKLATLAEAAAHAGTGENA